MCCNESMSYFNEWVSFVTSSACFVGKLANEDMWSTVNWVPMNHKCLLKHLSNKRKILFDCHVYLLFCFHDLSYIARTEIHVCWLHGNRMFSCESHTSTATSPLVHWWQPNTRLMGVLCKAFVIHWGCYHHSVDIKGVCNKLTRHGCVTYIKELGAVWRQTIIWKNCDLISIEPNFWKHHLQKWCNVVSDLYNYMSTYIERSEGWNHTLTHTHTYTHMCMYSRPNIYTFYNIHNTWHSHFHQLSLLYRSFVLLLEKYFFHWYNH